VSLSCVGVSVLVGVCVSSVSLLELFYGVVYDVASTSEFLGLDLFIHPFESLFV
jgi:hypothetical protein